MCSVVKCQLVLFNVYIVKMHFQMRKRSWQYPFLVFVCIVKMHFQAISSSSLLLGSQKSGWHKMWSMMCSDANEKEKLAMPILDILCTVDILLDSDSVQIVLPLWASVFNNKLELFSGMCNFVTIKCNYWNCPSLKHKTVHECTALFKQHVTTSMRIIITHAIQN